MTRRRRALHTLHPHLVAGALAALACLGSAGCAHAPLSPPRLVLAARFTQRAGGAREEVATATLQVPLEAPPPPPTRMPTPEAIVPIDASVNLEQRYGDEPTIDEVLSAALEGPIFDPGRAREARERARLSGLLPLLRVDVRRGSGWDLRTQQGASVETAVLASDDSWSVVGSATLRLDRLLFAREETSLLNEERHLEEARMRLATEVVRLYVERRRLQLERDRRGHTELPTEARIAELGAMLDALTRGGLSQRAR